MSEIAARIGEGIARWFRKSPKQPKDELDSPFPEQEDVKIKQSGLHHAGIGNASAAVRAKSGSRPYHGALPPQSRVTDAPGQACVQSDHIDFADHDMLTHRRKRHCGPQGSNMRYGEVQQSLKKVSYDPLTSAPPHGAHVLLGASMPERLSVGHQQNVSVATQITPQLQARTLSYLRPLLKQRKNVAQSSAPDPSHPLPPRSSLHDRENATFMTPAVSTRAGFAQACGPGHTRTSAPASTLDMQCQHSQGRQDKNLALGRVVVPSTARERQWDHHLQTYHALDATWGQKQAEIEALDTQRRKQLEERHERNRDGGSRPQSSTLSKALDLVQQLKWDEMEQESKNAVREVELAASLAQLRVASDRRQVAVQSVPKPGPSWATKAASVEPEEHIREEEDAGVVDLMSSSEEEGIMTDQAPAESDAAGVVDLLDSDDESEGSEDGEAATEESDASMSDGELRIDGTDKVLTPALLKEYRRLTTDIHGHEPFLVHPRARVAVTGEDMKLCGPGKWVGDACINMYMALLQDRDQEWCSEPDSPFPRVLFMNSHFVAKLCQEAAGYQYKNVARWTRAAKLKSGKLAYTGIKDLHKIVVPVHLGNHWTCAVLNFRDCQVEYYDSLLSVDHSTVKNLLRWVEDEFSDKYGGEVPDAFKAQTWRQVYNPDSTPQQMNGFDCGVFCMMCCNYAGADRAFDYGQREIHSFFRAMCAIECGIMRLRSLDD